jgi:hypothetical protein
VEVAEAVAVGIEGAANVLNAYEYGEEGVSPASVAVIVTVCPAPELIPVN